MKLSELKTLNEVIEERRQDPEFRKVWDGSAFTREVAILVTQYRAANKLTQRELAEKSDLTQSAIARLERGHHQPTLETLVKLTAHTGLAFHLDVVKGGVELAVA